VAFYNLVGVIPQLGLAATVVRHAKKDSNMSDSLTNIEIPVSKSKTIWLLIISTAFVLIGVLFVIDPTRFLTIWVQNPIIISVVGYSSILFFGFGIFVFISRLFQTRPGLIITDKGILYDTKDNVNGFIAWGNITNVSIIKIYRQQLIMLHVDNPDEFIKSQQKAIKRKLMSFNQNNYGAPIGLTASGFAISTDSLYKTITDRLTKYRQK
jgi:hypothetical protein